jgi:hypothetical protein
MDVPQLLKFLLTAWCSLPLEWIAIKMFFCFSSDGGVLTVWDEVEQDVVGFSFCGLELNLRPSLKKRGLNVKDPSNKSLRT